MATTEEDKQLSSNARASKLWRILRVASKSRLNVFDKMDDGNNLQALFEPAEETENVRDENTKDTPGAGLDVPLASSLDQASQNLATPPEPSTRIEVAE